MPTTLIELIQARLTPLAAGGSWYAINRAEPPVYPYIVFQRVSGTVDNTLDGPSSMQNTRVQVDVYGRQVGQVMPTATAVAEALTSAADFVALQLSFQDFYEPETKSYRCSADFSVWLNAG